MTWRPTIALASTAVAALAFGETGTSQPSTPAPRGDAPVPILMYHVIAPPPPRAPYPDLYVPHAAFAQQMGWLANRGFHAVTLREVL